jgi:murein DD-endopeptidase MepM/ murein hydrolase activator NlpD
VGRVVARVVCLLAAASVVSATATATTTAAEAARGSARVAALQVALRAERVYTGDVDGWAGSQTRRAVRLLQIRRGLVPDGVAGPATLRALGRRGGPRYDSRAITLGARGWDVAQLQFLLAWRGFPSGPMDGGFGPRTRAALLRYQAWASLTADGIAGRTTLAALRRAPPRAPLTMLRPVTAILGDRFGPRGNWFHPGLDFKAPAGTPVHAARSGRVAFAGWDAGGYGLLVVLDHGGGVTTRYAHLSALAVASGAQVAVGATVGQVGATGRATGPHLHFEVRVRDAAADPLPALR